LTGWYKFSVSGLIQIEDPDAGVSLISNMFGGHSNMVRDLRIACGGVVEVGYEETEDFEGNEK